MSDSGESRDFIFTKNSTISLGLLISIVLVGIGIVKIGADYAAKDFEWKKQDIVWKTNVERDIDDLRTIADDRWRSRDMQKWVDAFHALHPELSLPDVSSIKDN